MGMTPGADLVFGIDITGAEFPDSVQEALDRGEDTAEAVMEFLEARDGFVPSGDPYGLAGTHLAESRNLEVVQCEYAAEEYRTILAVSSANFSVSGWSEPRRIRVEQPSESDIENLSWALSVLGISPEISEPSWFLFSSFS